MIIKKEIISRYQWRVFSYVMLISFISTFNLFFSIFVWNKYDLSPNFAMGFISILFLILIVYNWIRDKKQIIKLIEVTQLLKQMKIVM